MLNLKIEFDDMIQELRSQDESEVYKLNVLTYENPIMFAGIDPANHHRQTRTLIWAQKDGTRIRKKHCPNGGECPLRWNTLKNYPS